MNDDPGGTPGKVRRCCICEHVVDPRQAVAETRPTGDSLQPRRWFYCTGCWSRMQDLRAGPDPAMPATG